MLIKLLHIVAILCVVFSVLAILWIAIWDNYQKVRFNKGICPRCKNVLIEFKDTCAPTCYAFECKQCKYITYVAHRNRLVDTKKSM